MKFKSKHLNLRITKGDIQFKDGFYETTDPAIIKFLSQQKEVECCNQIEKKEFVEERTKQNHDIKKKKIADIIIPSHDRASR